MSKDIREDQTLLPVSTFSPNLEIIRAVRNCEDARVDALAETGRLDPAKDFAENRFSDFDWRGTDTSKYVVRSPLPEQATAHSFLEAMTDDNSLTQNEATDQIADEAFEDTGQGFQTFLHSITDAVNVANQAYQRDGGLAGLSTGFVDLDRKLGGLHRSDLLVIAGRPSMGTTAFTTNLAFNIAKTHKRGVLPSGNEGSIEGGVVGFFSLELSSDQIATRILSETSEVPSEQIRRGDMTEAEFRRFVESAESLEASPLFIDDTSDLDIHELEERSRNLHKYKGLDLIVVDKLQNLKENSSRLSASQISRKLKNLAKSLDVPIIVTSSVSDTVERRASKRPLLSDFREYGPVIQTADVVMFLFREEFYVEREKPGDYDLEGLARWQEEMERLHGRAELIISKQRHGPIGTVDLAFEGRFTRFSNLVEPWQKGANEF